MARNHEKNYGQLNRLWLQKENEKHKKERRPKLNTLNSVAEIWKWVPSIKEEIDFCLMQSQVPCYTDRKVTEYHERLIQLEAEYKSFIRKAKSLDSGAVFTIGMKMPYTRRRKEKIYSKPLPNVIPLPVLDDPENEVIEENSNIKASEEFKNLDLPLEFVKKPLDSESNDVIIDSDKSMEKSNILGICYSSSDEET